MVYFVWFSVVMITCSCAIAVGLWLERKLEKTEK